MDPFIAWRTLAQCNTSTIMCTPMRCDCRLFDKVAADVGCCCCCWRRVPTISKQGSYDIRTTPSIGAGNERHHVGITLIGLIIIGLVIGAVPVVGRELVAGRIKPRELRRCGSKVKME
eukprot:scaffold26342_cov54-Attheya_sp.AAC.5